MSHRKKNINLEDVVPIYDTHNTYAEGGMKIHVFNMETGRCLCGYTPFLFNEVSLYVEKKEISILDYINQADPDGNICSKCKKILTKLSI